MMVILLKNNNVMVTSLYKKKRLDIAIKSEASISYILETLLILFVIRKLHTKGKTFSLPSYSSPFFASNKTKESEKFKPGKS